MNDRIYSGDSASWEVVTHTVHLAYISSTRQTVPHITVKCGKQRCSTTDGEVCFFPRLYLLHIAGKKVCFWHDVFSTHLTRSSASPWLPNQVAVMERVFACHLGALSHASPVLNYTLLLHP